MGGTNINQMLFTSEVFYRINHPYYRDGAAGLHHDIALFRLRFPARGPLVSTVVLATHEWDQIKLGVFQASGFGNTWTNYQISTDLVKVNLRVVDNAECQQAFYPRILESMLCVKWYDRFGQSNCHGDSGGPLTVMSHQFNGFPIQYGVFSSLADDCHLGLPVMYTKVSSYYHWIVDSTRNFNWMYYG